LEVVKGFWREKVVPRWTAFENALVSFLEESAFRLELACDVLLGRVPRKVKRRFWNRSQETPVLVDVYDWTDDRLIFSVLVWPTLDPDHRFHTEARRALEERVEGVIKVIAKGATEQLWSTYWLIDYDLRWDKRRGAWISSDGHAYDGARLYDYSRNGAA
jgi:hypothetical protein